MIRLILGYGIVILYLILGIIPLILLWLLWKVRPYTSDRISLSMVQTGFRLVLFACGVKVTAKGRENIPEDTAVLFVSNHRSYFDILVGYIQVKGLCGFVAKKQIKKAPLLSNWMVRLHCLFLDRDNIREGMKTILQGVEQLKNGISVWICPEGTRNKDANAPTLPFKEGSLKMAEKADCPVIPVAISGTYDVWERQFPRIKKGNVTIEFGKPFYIKDLDRETKKHVGAYTRDLVQEMLDNQLT